ncbi:MAG: hypothetical protein ACE5G9_06575 [Nitrospinales bacterium]
MKSKALKPRIQLLVIVFYLLASVSIAIAHGDDANHGAGENKLQEEVSHGLGVVSLWGLIILNSLYYYSMGYKRIPRQVKTSAPQYLKLPIKWKSRFRNYHYRGNPIVVAIAFLHGIWAEENNLLLWAGWGILVVLCLTGLIMKLQKADAPGAKANRLIHTQHAFSVIMLVGLLIGHALVD